MQTSLPKKQSQSQDQKSKVWSQRLDSKTIEVERVIKNRIKDKIMFYLEKIDEEKYSQKKEKLSQTEMNKAKTGNPNKAKTGNSNSNKAKMGNSNFNKGKTESEVEKPENIEKSKTENGEKTENDEKGSKEKEEKKGKIEKKRIIDVDNVLINMKNENKQMIIDNAKYVLDNLPILSFNDKRKINFEEIDLRDMKNKETFQKIKYINDKILPQIYKNTYKTKRRMRELYEKSEYDNEIKDYCREIENKIEKDLDLKLNDGYYEKKNQNMKMIFENVPKNYFSKKEIQVKDVNMARKKYQVKSSSINMVQDKKNKLGGESKVDYEKIYKDTMELILSSTSEKNILKYINTYMLDKSSKYILFTM